MVFIYITECNPLPIQDDHPAVSVIRSGDPSENPKSKLLAHPFEDLEGFYFFGYFDVESERSLFNQQEVIRILKKFVKCCKTPLYEQNR